MRRAKGFRGPIHQQLALRTSSFFQQSRQIYRIQEFLQQKFTNNYSYLGGMKTRENKWPYQESISTTLLKTITN